MDGFGGKAATPAANCVCPASDRITIYDGVDAADVTILPDGSINPATLNKTDIIYGFEAFLKAGNGPQFHSRPEVDTK